MWAVRTSWRGVVMTIDEETIERACYNAMRRREQEISDANGKQGKYFREQDYILSQEETYHLEKQKQAKLHPVTPKPIVISSAQEPHPARRRLFWGLWRK